MKAKSRRRLLISSVAMLLVAMLALGTATYAWFSINKTVTASGMTVTASAPKGLQVTTINGAASDAATSTNWASTMTFKTASTANLSAVSIPWTDTNKKLPENYFYPTTVKDAKTSGKAILTQNASNKADFAGWTAVNTYPTVVSTAGQDAFGVAKSADDTMNYLVAYTIGVRSTDDISSTDVKGTLSYTSATGSKYVKVALIDNNNEKTITLAKDTAIKDVYADATTKWNAITATTPTAAAVGTVKTGTTTFTFSGLNGCGDTGSKAHYYTLLMWVEGQDPDCYDANASLEGACTLKFSYT